MQKVFLVISMMISLSANTRPLSKIEITAIKQQSCQQGNDSILQSLDVNDGDSTPAPAPSCQYTAVFCKTLDKKLNRFEGPMIQVPASCDHKKALYIAIESLWNTRTCGGILSDRCVKPATCVGVDSSGYPTELGRNYQFPSDADRF